MLLKAAWSSLEEGLDTNVATTIIIIIINKEKGIYRQVCGSQTVESGGVGDWS